MPSDDRAAKLVITVDGFREPVLLFSRKRAKGTPKHKLFEFLGGGLDGNDPMEGLVRELEEEEKSGALAEHVRRARPSPRLVTVGGAPQYVFETTIPLELYLELRHAKAESFGFALIPSTRLASPGMTDRFTKKTVGILRALERLS
jgi:hypothetical protein